ncbi:hypothetical protein G9C98_003845 [Cotesia typhae]|uniref:Secreted protein n=1 Tax=Cotesia typhae TaxID=2053667 RepID=A0A8J5QM47_9HYME|nr:hypothetical protein G9C98_003845 [Cotesia typhae]
MRIRLRVLCAHGLSRLCFGGLQGECDVPAGKGPVVSHSYTSLARRKFADQFKMRCMQKGLLFH